MKNIWIWGCGCLGKIALKVLKSDEKWNIRGLIDNDIQKQNIELSGYLIRSFEEQKIKIARDDIILCCCTLINYKVIQSCLEENNHKKYMHFWDLDMKTILFQQLEEGISTTTISRCCTQRDFYSPSFVKIAEQMHLPFKIHRKYWEYVYIVQTLEAFQVLCEENTGLGFAVGLEPLPSFFADRKIRIMATDLPLTADTAKAWETTGQNAGGNLEKLYKKDICEKDVFQEYVQYRDVDMNDLPEDIGTFDFCWSSCAIEHVGSLEKSKHFLKNMLKVLKPGGIAVHTTEFNLISNEDTVEEGNSVIFRRKDIEEIQEWFTAEGHHMDVSFTRGSDAGDLFVDIPPFQAEPYHLNLQLDEYIVTSFAIIVQKAT